MNRNTVIEAIEKHKIIVILRGLTRDQLINTAEAMYKGGIRLAEVTYDSLGNPSDEETAANIRALAEAFPGMHIGAGAHRRGRREIHHLARHQSRRDPAHPRARTGVNPRFPDAV